MLRILTLNVDDTLGNDILVDQVVPDIEHVDVLTADVNKGAR